ncbi:hypothetical protein DSECCO2_561880 [anaerobic digester metagenome]
MVAAIAQGELRPGGEEPVVGDACRFSPCRPVRMQRIAVSVGILEIVVKVVAQPAQDCLKLNLLGVGAHTVRSRVGVSSIW